MTRFIQFGNNILLVHVPEGIFLFLATNTGNNGSWNVASFRPTNIHKKEDTGDLPNFTDSRMGYFHFCSSSGQKLKFYGLGSTSATIVAHILRVSVNYPNKFEYKRCFCEHTFKIFTGRQAFEKTFESLRFLAPNLARVRHRHHRWR